jgi:hypothetical protein
MSFEPDQTEHVHHYILMPTVHKKDGTVGKVGREWERRGEVRARERSKMLL